MIPHCQRNHVQWNMFPYTWAMVPQQKQSNLSWAAAISFSTLNCNESLSSISNENHSIHTKYGFWLPGVFCSWTRRQWCLNKCDIQAMDFLCLLKISAVINSFWFFCHPMETIKCVAILTSMQTTFFEQFRQQEGERLMPQAKPRWNNPHWDLVLKLGGFCQTWDRASLELTAAEIPNELPLPSHFVCEIYEHLLSAGHTESCIKGIDPAEVRPLAQSCV